MNTHGLDDDLLALRIWLPSEGSKWIEVKNALSTAKQSESLEQWIDNLQQASDLSLHSLPPNLANNVSFELDAKGRAKPKVRSFFSNLMNFMKENMSDKKIKFYCNVVFPSIIERAMDIHEYKPDDMDLIFSDSAGSVVLLKKWVCAIVSCCFLSIFPSHPNPNLTFNFEEFLQDLDEEKQRLKLNCILKYFERNVEQSVDLMDTVIFTRHYMTSKLAVCDLLNCLAPLCPLQISTSSLLSNSSEYCQVITGKKSFGDSTLKQGHKMVEKYFCERPELIAGMLFFGEMSSDCSILVQGTERWSIWANENSTDIASASPSILIFNAIGRCNSKEKGERKFYEISRILEEINRISFSLFRVAENQENSLDDDSLLSCTPVRRFKKPTNIMEVSSTSSSDSRLNISMQSRMWRKKIRCKSNIRSKCLLKQSSWRNSFETDSPPMTSDRMRIVKQNGSNVSSPDNVPFQHNFSFDFDPSSSISSDEAKNRRKSSVYLPSQRPMRRSLVGQSSFQSDYSDGSGSRRRSSAMSDMSMRSGSSSMGSGKRSSTDFSSEMEEYFQSDVACFHRSSIKTTVIEEESIALNFDEPGVDLGLKNGCVLIQSKHLAAPIPLRAQDLVNPRLANSPSPTVGRIMHTWNQNSALDHYVDNLINCVSEDSRNDVAEALKQRRISSVPLSARRTSLELMKDRCHSADDALNKEVRKEWHDFERILTSYVDNLLKNSVLEALSEIQNNSSLEKKLNPLFNRNGDLFGDGFRKYIPKTFSDKIDRMVHEVLHDARKEFDLDIKFINKDPFAHLPGSSHLLDIPKGKKKKVPTATLR